MSLVENRIRVIKMWPDDFYEELMDFDEDFDLEFEDEDDGF